MASIRSHFVRDPKTVGSVAPSGSELSSLVTNTLPLAETGAIVELGSGNGVFTEQILAKIGSDTKFFVMEIVPEFCEATRMRCPDARVYEDSAVNLDKYLRQEGIDLCDCIISSLPWASFDHEQQVDLLDAVWHSLRPGGSMITYCYAMFTAMPKAKRFRALLQDRFSNISKSRTVWSNIPPAFVYHAVK